MRVKLGTIRVAGEGYRGLSGYGWLRWAEKSCLIIKSYAVDGDSGEQNMNRASLNRPPENIQDALASAPYRCCSFPSTTYRLN